MREAWRRVGYSPFGHQNFPRSGTAGGRVLAEVAESHDNPQLAANFRRAAELALLSEGDVLALYEALRPNRATAEELEALAGRLDAVPAPLSAALVREAADVYARRGLLK